MRMTKSLTAAELRAYGETGLLFPKRALSPEAAAAYRAEWEDWEAANGEAVSGRYRYKSHLLFPFVERIMREPAMLDMVEDIIGADIMVWNTNLYPKEPGDGRFISWHQDSAHWGLDNNRVVTLWVALSAATPENGCMRMVPGSHAGGTVHHDDTWNPENILTRGQTIAQEIDPGATVWVALAPGECSLHHVQMMHSSPANSSDERRLAVAIRYITPSTRQRHHHVDYATLVRGRDDFGHFEAERRPARAMEAGAIAFHAEVAESQGKILLHGTERAGAIGLAETNSHGAA